MGCVVEQPLALGQVLVDQLVLVLLEVAQSPVHELGGLRRSARGEVVLLDQCGPQAAARRVEGDARSGDASADDQEIELLRRQEVEGACTGEPVGAGRRGAPGF